MKNIQVALRQVIVVLLIMAAEIMALIYLTCIHDYIYIYTCIYNKTSYYINYHANNEVNIGRLFSLY